MFLQFYFFLIIGLTIINSVKNERINNKSLISTKSLARVIRKLQENQITPDVVETIPTSLSYLKLIYSNGVEVKLGNELTPTQVKNKPTKVNWRANSNALYTLCMIDPDVPSRNNPFAREWLHWLVVNIPGNQINYGDILNDFVGSAPPKGKGFHRYVFIVYKQPNRLNADDVRITNRSSTGRALFRIKDFAKKYNLGEPIAINFYLAEWDEYVPKIHRRRSGK